MLSEDLATTQTDGPPTYFEAYNLRHEIDELRASAEYATAGHSARTLVRAPTFRVVLYVITSGTEFKQHHTAQPVAIQVLSGRVRISLPTRLLEPATGEMLLIESGVAHDVSAVVDSAFLHSMPWSERTDA